MRDLFDDHRDPVSPLAFKEALDAWLAAEQKAGRLRQPSSVEVYAHMWNALSTWAVADGLAGG